MTIWAGKDPFEALKLLRLPHKSRGHIRPYPRVTFAPTSTLSRGKCDPTWGRGKCDPRAPGRLGIMEELANKNRNPATPSSNSSRISSSSGVIFSQLGETKTILAIRRLVSGWAIDTRNLKISSRLTTSWLVGIFIPNMLELQHDFKEPKRTVDYQLWL